jgi:hypothetical protein
MTVEYAGHEVQVEDTPRLAGPGLGVVCWLQR